MLESIKIKAKKLKNQIFILYRVLGYKECGLLPKVLIWVVIGLFLSPIDLIPDFIPILGYLDDLILLPLLILAILKMIPEEAIKRAEKEISDNRKIEEKYAGKVTAIIITIIWLLLALILYIRIRAW